MIGGVVLSLAGSPAVAERLGYDSFHFVNRHLAFFLPALAVMIGTSFLTPRQARRAALIVLGIALALMFAVLFVGVENNGSRRWLNIAGLSLQPSEFMKPAFVVICAWLFAENSRRTDIPGNVFALILLAIVAALLVAEPDFGQTMLIAVAWGALFFMAGLPWLWIAALGVVGVGGIFAAYTFLPHVAGRIDRFLAPHTGDTFQVDTAMDSIMSGGWLGRGPGEGTVKRILPDAHTDFIFAVAAEEFGIIICIALVLVFAFVVIRGLGNSLRSEEAFTRLAVGRPRRAVRRPGGDQHGREPQHPAGQGHDAALHLLRRLVDDRGRLRHGADPRAHPPPPRARIARVRTLIRREPAPDAA